MVFDDYLWAEGLRGDKDPLRCPKPAIDAFINIYLRKLQILPKPLYRRLRLAVAEVGPSPGVTMANAPLGERGVMR
jgi:hypothetical protein